MKIEAVSFDMDGTLIRNTNSVRYLCTLNGKTAEFEELQKLEDEGSLSWIEGDFRKAQLIEGLRVAEAEAEFDDNIAVIQNTEQVIGYVKSQGIRSVLITAGPIQVAHILGTRFGFDAIYGSEYEVIDQRFTGKIIHHLGDTGKLTCLGDFCSENDVSLAHCVAIGDSKSDIPLFESCGHSIAINSSEAVGERASEYIITEDLSEIVGILQTWLAQ
jgi:phosphoserine phosphatase